MSITVSGRLFIDIIKASNLPSMDFGSESDPFAVIKVGKRELGKTKTIDNCNNPIWKESKHFDLEIGIGEAVVLEVYDYDMLTNSDFMGKVTIPFQTIRTYRDDERDELTVRLEGPKCKPNSTITYIIAFKRFTFDDEIARLEEANTKLKEKLKSLQEENLRLQTISDNLNNEVNSLKETKTELQGNVQKFTEENTKLTENRENLEQENNKYQELNVKLKNNVDAFQEQNGKLKTIVDQLAVENQNFHHEVERLSGTINSLESVKKSIEEFAEQNQQDFESIISSLNNTLDEQRNVVHEQKKVALETEANTRKQEKLLLLQLQAQCQFVDNSFGMDKKEFQLWKNLIPKKYLTSGITMDFDLIDFDKDGIISMSEFNVLVDKLVIADI